MQIDAVILSPDLVRAAEEARHLEELGFDGIWTAETQHDPFLPLAVAATTTSRVSLGTAIAVAFPRSPMVTAMLAWDLQRASRGRFILGLGTQVKAHNERRFSVPFTRPGPRLKELVLALKHIWGAFQGEHPLQFHGEFYRFDLLPPFFNPGPQEWPKPKVFLAAVNRFLYRTAAEVADGVHVHGFHTLKYLKEVALPEVDRGLARSGRSRQEFTLAGPVFAVVGKGEERERAEAFVRSQIAFYGSTRTYRPVLEIHGWGELTDRLHALSLRGDWGSMTASVGREVLEEFAVFADDWVEAARAVREKYRGILDRVSFYAAGGPSSEAEVKAMVRAFHE